MNKYEIYEYKHSSYPQLGVSEVNQNEKLMKYIDRTAEALDTSWLLVGTTLVFIMQVYPQATGDMGFYPFPPRGIALRKSYVFSKALQGMYKISRHAVAAICGGK